MDIKVRPELLSGPGDLVRIVQDLLRFSGSSPDSRELFDTLTSSLAAEKGVSSAFLALYDPRSASLGIVSVGAEDGSLRTSISSLTIGIHSPRPVPGDPRAFLESAILSAYLGGRKGRESDPSSILPSHLFSPDPTALSSQIKKVAAYAIPGEGMPHPYGVLALTSPDSSFPTDSQRGLLSDLAVLLGSVLDRFERDRERAFALPALLEIERLLRVSDGDDVREIFSKAVRALSDAFRLPLVFIGVVISGQPEVRVSALAGPARATLGEEESGFVADILAHKDLVRKAETTGEIQTIEDLPFPDQSKAGQDRIRQSGLRSGLLVPAQARGKSTLLLGFFRVDAGRFSPEFLSLVSALAGSLASFYDKRLLEMERARLTSYQEAVRMIQQAFLSAVNCQELFEIVVRTIESVTDSVAAFILVRPPGSAVLEMVAYSTKDASLAQAITGIRFPLEPEEGLSPTVVARAYTRRCSVVERFSEGLEALRFYTQIHPEFSGVRSIMGTPAMLIGREDPEAVLAVWSLNEKDFTPDLVLLAEQLAESLSRAIERLDRESEVERLSLVAQKSTDVILMTDALGRILWTNRAFETKYGYSQEEIRGHFPADFRTGSDTDGETLERIRAHVANGRSFEETMVLYSRDKIPFWVRVNATVLRTPSGEPSGYVSVETDVTALKESEERVRIGSLFYRGLSETIQALRAPTNLPPVRLLSTLLERLRDHLDAHFLFIGTLQRDQRIVQPLTGTGPVEDFLETSVLTSDSDRPEGRGPVGIALRTGLPQLFLKDDPGRPGLGGGSQDSNPPMGGIAAAAVRTKGDRVLILGQFPDEEFLSLESAELFQRIIVEIAAFLDRRERQEEDMRIGRYSTARQIIAKDLLSSGTEEEIYRILARTISEETEALAVDCLVPEGDRLKRRALSGRFSRVVWTLASDLPQAFPSSGPVPTPIRVWNLREPVLIKNPASDPTMVEAYRTAPFEPVRLVASFPVPGLKEGDLPMGVLTLFLENSESFDNLPLRALVIDILESASLAIDRLRLLRRMETLSTQDPLTGLLNRRGLEIALLNFLAAIRRNQGWGVLGILDIDDFKPVNDSYGHSSGDALLAEISRRLRQTLRENDLVARLGGDEFVIVSSLAMKEDLSTLMDRLSAALDQPYSLPDAPPGLRMGVSMGLTLYPEDQSDPDGLLRHADEALYLSKRHKPARSRWWTLWTKSLETSSETPAPDPPLLSFSEAYGERARDLIDKVREPLESGIRSFSDLFYGSLAGEPRFAVILDRLSPSDLLRLKESQGEHLRMIMSPDLKEEDHRKEARNLGRIHAMVGVSYGGLVEAMRVYLSTLRESLRQTGLPFSERTTLLTLLTHRSGVELEEQLNGMSDLETGRQSQIARLTDQLSRLWTWPDYVRLAMDTLSKFDGVSKTTLVHPGEGMERFVFEVSVEGTGHSPEDLREERDGNGEIWNEDPVIRSEIEPLLARAWHEKTTIHIVGTRGDPLLPFSGNLLYDRGIRSLVLLPLKTPEDHQFAILLLASSYPGYFDSPFFPTFLSGLASLFAQGWHRFISRKSSGFGAYSHQVLRRLLSSRRVIFQYQPVIDFPSGRASKVELLSRIGSGMDPIPPVQFLPAFGRSELVDLMRQGVEAGLDQIARCEKAGVVLDLTINLPPLVLFEPGLARWLSRSLESAGVPPSRLHLELPESEELYAASGQFGVLSDIASCGILLDMDDFGSGYSTLLRLRTLRFAAIKIDLGRVGEGSPDPARLVSLMGSLVKLIQGLGHKAVIEGLESTDLLEAARILGADGAQGYALSRPLDGESLPEWIGRFRLPPLEVPPRSALGREASLWMQKQYGMLSGD